MPSRARLRDIPNIFACYACGAVVHRSMSTIQCDVCYTVFCSTHCAQQYYADDAEKARRGVPVEEDFIESCAACRLEVVSDATLGRLLLEIFGMSRETAMHLIRGHLANKYVK